MQSRINDIKSELRLYMNGMLAQSLRERGLRYRLIFGIELPRLKEIAAKYIPDQDLAAALWHEDIRECRILAGYLQPVETFTPQLADVWLDAMHDTEIIDYTCMNLFRRLPYAKDKALQWIASDDVLTQYAGYRLMSHLLRSNEASPLSPRDRGELFDQAEATASSANPLLQQIAREIIENHLNISSASVSD
ncbi:MAG: DNA alkylation repair protein [Bacteroidaceae bacterium]|nr:DNA alkylation repair protein [Bacteroidaceae bacterium]